jgi:hypothetical protein
LNCSTLSNTLGTITANTCDCASGFFWNATSSTCYCDPTTSSMVGGICVDCYTILNNNGANPNNSACLCIPPYQWQWNSINQTGDCICNSSFSIIPTAYYCLDCTTVPYALGTVTNNTCDCLPTFVWDPNSWSCFCDYMTSYIVGNICLRYTPPTCNFT